jgi:hypothetical protein
MPKPPPTSGVTTRNFSGGRLKTLPASRFFTSQEPWVPQWRVNLPSADSYSAVAARPSMLATTTRLFTTVSRVTWAALEINSSALALSPVSQSKQTLLSIRPRPSAHRARAPRRGR